MFLQYSSSLVQEFFKNRPKSLDHKCRECSYITSSLFSILNHIKSHWIKNEVPKLFDCASSTPERYFCEECNFTTSLTTVFNNHIKNHNTEDRKYESQLYECKTCSFTTGDKSRFQKHIDDHKKAPFICKKCNFFTKYKCNLKTHIRLQHDGNFRWFTCELCDFKGKFTSILKKHMLAVHTAPGEIKWFECAQCSYKAKRKHTLKMHSLTHRKKKSIKVTSPKVFSTTGKYKCKLCVFGTEKLSSLNNHIRDHHKGYFYCNDCSFKSKRKEYLKQHIINKHSATENIKWFECDECDFKTKNSVAYLRRHKKRMHR